ncbi:MAG TPA: carboxypeptidase-like regulatory domain-containing protein, partial [Chitinophagaceae bacterium]|nr:carboxypeptidase-like regulatory domain-containing protein [Chitinophagaceae bacterium]
MRKLLFLFFLFAFVKAEAQNKLVSGTVKDQEGPITGVTVTVDGTSAATQTDKEGKFKLSANPNSTLVVTFVGYTTKKVPVTGATDYDIILMHEDVKLQEVVVTALGISREKKSLGYA